MMDWIAKLPGGAICVLALGSAWFGFNYAVLAERAMTREVTNAAVPACVKQMEEAERAGLVEPSGIGAFLGMPELHILERRLVERAAPQALALADKTARCACALAQQTAKLRFDYAVHTASFRLVPVSASERVRVEVSELLSGECSS